jgi:hypothetical protein
MECAPLSRILRVRCVNVKIAYLQETDRTKNCWLLLLDVNVGSFYLIEDVGTFGKAVARIIFCVIFKAFTHKKHVI